MKRRLLFWTLLAAGTGLSIAGLTVGLFPKLITGDYCRVTITAVEIGPEGNTTITYQGKSSSGTRKVFRILVDDAGQTYGESASGGLPAWPGAVAETVVFSL